MSENRKPQGDYLTHTVGQNVLNFTS